MPADPTSLNTTINANIFANNQGKITAASFLAVMAANIAWTIANFVYVGSPLVVSGASATIAANTGPILLSRANVQTVTLPAASSQTQPLAIKDSACVAGTYVKTILPAGSDTIDGQWTAANGGVGLYDDCESLTFVPVSGGWSLQ